MERSVPVGRKAVLDFRVAAATLAARYAWYVRVVQQKVSENWLKYEIDPKFTRQIGCMCLRHRPQRAADQCTDRAVERGTVAGSIGGASDSAHRHLWTAAAGLFRQQGHGGILVRLQEITIRGACQALKSARSRETNYAPKVT